MAFQNAQNFAISAFHAYNYVNASGSGNMQTPPIPDPIKIIEDARAVEATHTSKTASYAPKCHPKTRAKIIQHIVSWGVAASVGTIANDNQHRTSILWLQGPAGGGKTCIVREVASQLAKKGLLAGTFFFSNRIAGLNSEVPFVATLVHQLLSTVPELKPTILEAVIDNIGIFRESLETQISELILKPFEEFEPGPMGGKKAIVVDGFDECVIEEREHLLRILHTLVSSTISLTLIVASRPEYDIRTTFASEDFQPMTHVLQLQDYNDGSEIRQYLCDEFRRIRMRHPACASIPASWPEEEAVVTLVQRSSGNYILPATVIKHVDNPRRNPLTSLQEVMACFDTETRAALTKNPLSPLDAIYTMILHPQEGDLTLMKRILHCLARGDSIIMAINPRSAGWSPEFFDQLFELEPGTTDITLCDIHSVVGVSPRRPIVFHHATLRDFLCSESRSKDLFQTPYETVLDLSSSCARRLDSWSRGQIRHQHQVSLQYASAWMPSLVGRLLYLAKAERCANPQAQALPQTILQFDHRLALTYHIVSGQSTLGLSIERDISQSSRTASLLVSLYSEEFASRCTLGQPMTCLSLLGSLFRTLSVLSAHGIPCGKTYATEEQIPDAEYRYLAPELLHSLQNGKTAIPTEPSAVYSLAFAIYELFTGESLAWKAQRRRAAMKPPSKPSPTGPAYTRNGMTDDLWDMLVECWNPDPDKRPSYQNILNRLFTHGMGQTPLQT